MSRPDMAEIFEVCVGEHAKTFVMHRDIAIHHSSFFKVALSNDWKEAQEKRISLPDCEIEIFEDYLQWIYTGEVAYYSELPKQALELVKLWILGDFLGDQNFCNAVGGGLFSQPIAAGSDAINYLYDHTSQDSPLRSHMFSIWASRTSIAFVARLFATNREYPKDFVIDLLNYLTNCCRVVDNTRWAIAPFPVPAVATTVTSDTAAADGEEDEERT